MPMQSIAWRDSCQKLLSVEWGVRLCLFCFIHSCRCWHGRYSDRVRLLLQLVTFHLYTTPATQIPVLRYSSDRSLLLFLSDCRVHLHSSAESTGTSKSRYGSKL